VFKILPLFVLALISEHFLENRVIILHRGVGREGVMAVSKHPSAEI